MQLALSISPRRITGALILVALCLCLASIASQLATYFLSDRFPWLYQVASLLNVIHKDSIPTWYSASLLAGCALLLAMLAASLKIHGGYHACYWSGLALIFLYLSLVKFVGIYKQGNPLQPLIKASGIHLGSFLFFSLVMLAILCVFVCVLFYLRFLAHLPLETRRYFLIAGALFIGSSMGIDMIGEYYGDLYQVHIVQGLYVDLDGSLSLTGIGLATIEEFLEMLGSIVFIYALLSYGSQRQVQIDEETVSRAAPAQRDSVHIG